MVVPGLQRLLVPLVALQIILWTLCTIFSIIQFRTSITVERRIRQVANNLYLGDGMVFCFVQPLQTHMVLEGADKGMTPHLCRGYEWEPEISLVLQSLVHKGDHVLDVGTNVGYYTIMFAQIVTNQGRDRANGRVMGIEANPRMYQLAQRTLEFNHFLTGTVELLHRAAYYADNKILKMTVRRDRPLNNFVTEVEADDPRVQYSGIESKDVKAVDVPTVTIDTAVSAWDQLNLIKIDVEGAEAQVYGGLGKTLERFPKVTIVMEVNSARMGEPARAFYEQIQRDFPRLQRIVGTRIVDTSVQELLNNRQGDDLLVLRRTGFEDLNWWVRW